MASRAWEVSLIAAAALFALAAAPAIAAGENDPLPTPPGEIGGLGSPGPLDAQPRYAVLVRPDVDFSRLVLPPEVKPVPDPSDPNPSSARANASTLPALRTASGAPQGRSFLRSTLGIAPEDDRQRSKQIRAKLAEIREKLDS